MSGDVVHLTCPEPGIAVVVSFKAMAVHLC